MALKELYRAFVRESDFWQQVAGACMIAASKIAEEDPGTSNHAKRLLWALSVRDNPKAVAIGMLVDVIRDETIAADVENALDSDVQDVVNGLVNKYATG